MSRIGYTLASAAVALAVAAVFVIADTKPVHAQLSTQPPTTTTCPDATLTKAQRVPYRKAEKLTFSGNEDFLTAFMFTVPAGKIFTAEHVSGLFSSDGNQKYYVQLSDANTFEQLAYFTVTDGAAFQGNQVAQIRTLNQPFRADYTAGQEIVLAVQRSKTAGFTQATVQIAGYLSDEPCSSPR